MRESEKEKEIIYCIWAKEFPPQISAARVIIHHCFIDNRARRNSIKNSLVRHRRWVYVLCGVVKKVWISFFVGKRERERRRRRWSLYFHMRHFHRHVIHFSLLYIWRNEMHVRNEMKWKKVSHFLILSPVTFVLRLVHTWMTLSCAWDENEKWL